MDGRTKLLIEYARFFGEIKSLIAHVEHGLISNEDLMESVKRAMVRFERERNRLAAKESHRELGNK